MTDFKVDDVVYYNDERLKVSRLVSEYRGIKRVELSNGSIIFHYQAIPEKDYLTQRLAEIEAEESKPNWPIPKDTPHYSYDEEGIIGKEPSYLKNVFCNQALSERRAKQNFELAKLRQDMCLWVDTFCPEWEPDWSDSDNKKWGIHKGRDLTKIIWSVNADCFFLSVTVPRFELAQEILKEFGQRIEEWYKNEIFNRRIR